MMTLFAKLSKNKSNEEMMDLLNFPSASSEQVNALTQLSRSLCDNTKIKKNLGISLLYPTYREGLMSIFENGNY